MSLLSLVHRLPTALLPDHQTRDLLPPWLQEIALFIPTSYVFEGMRALLLDGQWRGDLLRQAFMLNCIYFSLGMSIFLLAFRSARKHGLLLQAGE